MPNRFICIAGKNKIAVDAMQYLLDIGISKRNLLACCNKNDDGVDNWQPSFRRFCTQNEIPIKNLGEIYNLGNLLFISLEFDRIINPEYFKSAALFNIHFSKLPSYKGMFTSVFPILNGESDSGVTLHKIDKGIDTGDAISQITFPLRKNIKSIQLYMLFIENGIQLFKEKFQDLLANSFIAIPQPSEHSSYFSKHSLNFNASEVDFLKTAFQVRNWIHAFNFRPFQLPQFNGRNISHAEVTNVRSIPKPGKAKWIDDYSVDVSTIDFDVRLYFDRIDEILKACEIDDSDFIKMRITEGYDINDWGINGWTPLIVAVYHHSLFAVKELLDAGANVNATNFNGTSVLMYAMDTASRSGDVNILKQLLSRGARLNHKDYRGVSILEYAHSLNNTQVIECLINAQS